MDPLSLVAMATSIGKLGYDIFTGERERSDTLSLQEESWAREDTAVQRRMADLKAAGLNPLLAVGAPASTMAPMRPGGRSSIAESGNILQGALMAQEIGMRKAQISNTKAQNLLLNAQAAKTIAEKSEVENRSEYYKQLTGSTAQNLLYLKAQTGLTEQRIENLTLEYLTEQAKYQNLSADTILKQLRYEIEARDLSLLKRLGLMKDTPSGLVGQGAQVANQIFTILDRVVGALMGSPGDTPSYGTAELP